MKFSRLIQAFVLALFTHLAYANAINTRSIAARSNTTIFITSPNFEDLVAYQLPDGRRRIDFYDNGTLEGYAIETVNGATFFDIDSSEVNFDDVTDFNKRISEWRLALKFAKLIAKWGKKAWDNIYCAGANSMCKCSDDYLQCAQEGYPPWKCVDGILCAGAAARSC